jgi:hypothetical protein
VPVWAIFTVLAAISCGVYFNTFQAGFTYDDFFAVVRSNGKLENLSWHLV